MIHFIQLPLPHMTDLTLIERKNIYSLLNYKMSLRSIAKTLKRSVSTISDELTRNGGRLNYDPCNAQKRACEKKSSPSHTRKLDHSPVLKQHVINQILQDWSPEQISGDLKAQAKNKSIISHETIYTLIYSSEGKKLKLWTHLRTRKKPERVQRGVRKKRPRIPERVSIHQRPLCIDEKRRLGDWEGDTVHFSDTNISLAVFTERKTKLVFALMMEDRTAKSFAMAIHELISTAGQVNVLSITLDNGSENYLHAQVRHEYAETFDTYFCDAYCSWQKGLTENSNLLFRQYLPRWTPHSDLTQDLVDYAVKHLNNRPRKTLSYRTPLQAFNECSD